MNIKQLSLIVSLVLTLAGAGWWAATTLATSDQVTIAESKADYSLDLHIQSLNAQLGRLMAKKNKTQDDRDQIRWLRDEIKRLRTIRAIRTGSAT